MMSNENPRKLFLMRHGERIDFTFGEWIPSCFDESGNYKRTDLNMPETLPKRSQGHLAYSNDSPLTRIGLFQAEVTGEAFNEAQLEITHVYCSPSIRCVQSSDAFLKGYKKRDEIKIRIEPGLFEWLEWYSKGVPKFMTPEELAAAGYNIDLDYVPNLGMKKLAVLQETFQRYYSRGYLITKAILETSGNGNVLFVGHSATLETCSRELVGKKPRRFDDMASTIRTIPYCSVLQLNQIGDKWEIADKPILGITHSRNYNFDQNMLTN